MLELRLLMNALAKMVPTWVLSSALVLLVNTSPVRANDRVNTYQTSQLEVLLELGPFAHVKSALDRGVAYIAVEVRNKNTFERIYSENFYTDPSKKPSGARERAQIRLNVLKKNLSSFSYMKLKESSPLDENKIPLIGGFVRKALVSGYQIWFESPKSKKNNVTKPSPPARKLARPQKELPYVDVFSKREDQGARSPKLYDFPAEMDPDSGSSTLGAMLNWETIKEQIEFEDTDSLGAVLENTALRAEEQGAELSRYLKQSRSNLSPNTKSWETLLLKRPEHMARAIELFPEKSSNEEEEQEGEVKTLASIQCDRLRLRITYELGWLQAHLEFVRNKAQELLNARKLESQSLRNAQVAAAWSALKSLRLFALDAEKELTKSCTKDPEKE
jgi:hypothetical protein